MAIKMRVLYASNKSKIAAMADIVKKEYDLAINAVDKFPRHIPATMSAWLF